MIRRMVDEPVDIVQLRIHIAILRPRRIVLDIFLLNPVELLLQLDIHILHFLE